MASKGKRIEYLDGLRGLAALSVVFCHLCFGLYPGFYSGAPASLTQALVKLTPLNLLTNGNTPVQCFFVLSGYLIARRACENRETALRFRAFSPKSIIAVNRSGAASGAYDAVRKVEELNELLPQCDILVISLPGTPETCHMINEEKLSLLPDGALIVNVGRGSVIDTPALVRELTNGRLKAVLDVFETEPLPPNDPLWDCPNLIITQHTAGNMTLPYTVQRIVDMFLEDLQRFARGETPLHLVDRTRGY